MEWTNESINVLGIHIEHDTHQMTRSNYEKLLPKIKGILKTWRSRRLSLFGKILVVNTLVASLFNYKMAVLPEIPQDITSKIEEMIESFLWNNHKPKFSLRTLQCSKECGGADLINLNHRDMAIKTGWIDMLSKDKKSSKLVFNQINQTLNTELWQCNLQVDDIKYLGQEKGIDPFWIDVMKAWFRMNPDCQRKDFIWWNSEIHINNKPIFWKNIYENGLKYVHQLYNSQGLKSIRNLIQEYVLTLMQANQLVSAIPAILKKEFKNEQKNVSQLDAVSTNKIYKQLCTDDTILRKKHTAWMEELGFSFEYKKLIEGIKDIYTVTNVPKLRSFQYRLLNRAIITNIHLKHWKMRENDKCSFCNLDRESYSHLFVKCDKVAEIWTEVERFMSKLKPNTVEETIHFDVDTVLWNRIFPGKAGHVINLACLLVKQYIYKQRCMKLALNVNEVKAIIISTRNIERYIAVKNNKLYKHRKKWGKRKKKLSKKLVKRVHKQHDNNKLFKDQIVKNKIKTHRTTNKKTSKKQNSNKRQVLPKKKKEYQL